MENAAEELIINGRFRVVSTLLRTPAGYVYKATDLQRNSEYVVVKRLMPSSVLGIGEAEIKDRYGRETSVLSKVTHPGIPRLLNYFVIEENYYIVLEFFEGETLDALSLKRSTPFPVRDVLDWSLSLCDIMIALHTTGLEPIIFRDVTPSNIMVTGDGAIKLGDFGLTRYFNPDKIKDTFVMGTPGFSPPEQYGKGQSDVRSDIYSLGATMFYCLSLHSLEEYARKTPPLKRLNPLIPGAFEKIVLKCIEKDPRRRFQSAGELKDELQKCRTDR